MKDYPTRWQRKMMWAALTACFVVVLVVVAAAVTAIFIAIQNLEGLLYAPRIVGNYIGLYPMTVIVSIFVWGLIIGGVIGLLLAVPVTATLTVLFCRYVWGRRLREQALSIERVLADEEIEVPTHH